MSNSVGFGLFNREVTYDESNFFSTVGACRPYANFSERTIFDATFRAAQAFGLTAWIAGFVMLVIVWSISPCVASSRAGWRVVGGIFCFIGLSQILSLLMISSNVCSAGCTLKGDGVIAIFACILWWAAAAICCMVPDAKEPNEGQSMQSRQVVAEVAIHNIGQGIVMASETTTHQIEQDGTIVTEKVTTNPDGSTTVTTTHIPPAAVAVSSPDVDFEKQ